MSTTYLEAMNYVIESFNGTPVTSDAATGMYAVNARARLDAASQRLQKNKWWFNVDYDVELVPDEITGEIMVPALCSETLFVQSSFEDWDGRDAGSSCRGVE